jgi:Peptidase M16 inactive domain
MRSIMIALCALILPLSAVAANAKKTVPSKDNILPFNVTEKTLPNGLKVEQANAAFTTHTYKHTTMGFIKDIEDMPNQYEYSKDFFSRWYRPEKATMFVVGDVKPDQVFPLVEKYWGDWKRGNFVADIPKEPQANGPVYEHVAWPTPTSPWVTVAFHGPAFLDLKHQTAIDTAFDIEFGETSEIYKRLVEDEQKVDRLFTDGRPTRSSLSRPRASDFGGFDFPRPEARGPRPA